VFREGEGGAKRGGEKRKNKKKKGPWRGDTEKKKTRPGGEPQQGFFRGRANGKRPGVRVGEP